MCTRRTSLSATEAVATSIHNSIMDLSGITILITGATSGIGLAFAERLMKAGSTVIICGRREELLNKLKEQHPGLHTRMCDVSEPAQRIALFEWATTNFPDLNILINNAGIQRFIKDLGAAEDWETTRSEIAINLDAPIHLSRLFIPFLLKQKRPAIMNVTSGLAFVPKCENPVYCATKAALHSFTLSMRYQLKDGPIRVIEMVPPAVNTDLGGPGLHDWAPPLKDFADSVIADMAKGQDTIYFGFSKQVASASPSGEEWGKFFQMMNSLGK